MIYSIDTAIVCPRANKTEQPLVVELGKTNEIESRIQEIAFVTPQKAPELLARFNEAYLYIHKQISMLEYELVQAEREAGKARAVVLLDKVPSILEQKGLGGKNKTGSEDLRNAILELDEDYQKSMVIVEQIRCVVELLKGKLKGFEMAFTSVKKILGEGSFNMLSRLNPGSGTGEAPVGGNNTLPGFGIPRYAFDKD